MGEKLKALALISGGLDSLLAARVVMEQGIEVQGVAFIMQFASKDLEVFKRDLFLAAEDAGVPTRTVDISEEFLKLIKGPGHGFGANMNPCIDCKILMLRTAKSIAEGEHFDIIVTGEVLGERPMSQRRDALNVIRRESEAGEMLLRPLSAKLMPETPVEKKGLVDRERLLDIKGRSRKRQFELAERYSITKYFSPAGGCLLTAEEFSRKLADLKEHGQLVKDEVALLKYGRHFRLGENTKAVIGRNRKDNERLKEHGKGKISFRLKGAPGPYGLLAGDPSSRNIRLTASLVAGHSKCKTFKEAVVLFGEEGKNPGEIIVTPMVAHRAEELRI